MRSPSPSVLLSSAFGPFGVTDAFGHRNTRAEFFPAHLTRGQAMFDIRGSNPYTSLHTIAANLDAPSRVLENPSRRAYLRELRSGDYSYVALTTVVATNEKVREMARLARQVAPRVKVVVGGYGVAIEDPEEYFGTPYICRGDGVAYMKELLGEPRRPFVDPQTESRPARLFGVQLPSSLYVVGSLGCDKACDFCITSYFFRCKTTGLLGSGARLLELILQHRRHNDRRLRRQGIQNVFIFSEDFLADYTLVTEFHDLYRALRDDLPVSIGCFGSAAAVAQYDPAYLAEAGITSIWIGVESRLFRHRKLRDVDVSALFRGLHRSGIVTTASLILGLPEHTPSNIQEDVDLLLSLGPTFCQFSLYTPLPGTPAYTRAIHKGWLRSDYDSRLVTGFNEYFDHPAFPRGALESLLKDCLRREMAELGPSVLRYAAALTHRASNATAHPTYHRAKALAAHAKRTLVLATFVWPVALLYRPSRVKTATLWKLLMQILGISGLRAGLALLFSPMTSLLALSYWGLTAGLEHLGLLSFAPTCTRDYRMTDTNGPPITPSCPTGTSSARLHRRFFGIRPGMHHAEPVHVRGEL